MLSYDDALARILAAAGSPLPAEPVPPEEAAGRALAADVTALADLPPFANSAVDGFAVRAADTEHPPVLLRVTQTIPAGRAPARAVGPGEAARIFTGAPLPFGADALVMVEDTEATDEPDQVRLLAPGAPDHIRRAGSDIRRGERALAAGTTLDAGAIGLLSALNRKDVSCIRRPRVGLLTTGDEVVPVGDAALLPGQIRNSNAPALAAAIRAAGALVAVRRHARDDPDAVREALHACADCDVIIAVGGVSVGDYDYVKQVVGEIGRLDFWRVAIKPGKPLAFGQIHNALFFGLPGNPVSALVTFELFVRPVLRRLSGHAVVQRPRVSAVLAAPLPHAPGRREFARARLDWEDGVCRAIPTGAQGSHRLASLAGANALLIAHEDHGDYAEGEALPALLLAD